MNTTLNKPAVDSFVFDETLFDSEPPCEFAHTKTACGVHVTHAIRTCDTRGLVCQVAADNRKLASMDGRACKGCHQPASECWVIHPI